MTNTNNLISKEQIEIFKSSGMTDEQIALVIANMMTNMLAPKQTSEVDYEKLAEATLKAQQKNRLKKKKEKEEKRASIEKNKSEGKGSRKTSSFPIEKDVITLILENMESNQPEITRKRKLLFMILLNTKLRTSDAIRLQVKHVRNSIAEDGGAVIKIIEKKTEKEARIKVNATLAEAIEKYVPVDADPEEYLFSSRQSNGKEPYISRSTAYRWINDAAVKSGLINRDENGVLHKGQETLSPHSLRKAWALAALRSGKPIEMISLALNHASVKITKLYLNLRDEDLDAINEGVTFDVEMI